MAVVAGLFDDQVEATQAMDEILHLNIDDLETRVIESQGNLDAGTGGTVFPVIPNTSGGISQSVPGAAAVPGFRAGDFGWLDELEEVERAFYYEGTREGATLAMARVPDDHADHIRQVFREYGARTYKKE